MIAASYTQYSNIPSFHATSKGKLHTSGVNPKPGPFGPDRLIQISKGGTQDADSWDLSRGYTQICRRIRGGRTAAAADRGLVEKTAFDYRCD